MNVSIKPDVKLIVHLDVFSEFSSIHLSKYVLVGDYDSPFCWNIVFGISCIRLGFEPYQFDPFFTIISHPTINILMGNGLTLTTV
jgi:hypothetical protein